MKLNTNYKIELEILSPLHIGTDQQNDWTLGIDYVVDRQKLYILNKNLVWRSLDQISQDRYINFLEKKNLRQLAKFIKEQLDLEKISDHILPQEDTLSTNDIKALIRDGNGHPYVPGSSIKGAMASAILNQLHEKYKSGKISKNIEQDLLGSFSKNIMRFIRPYDASFNIQDTEVNIIELLNLYDEGIEWVSDFKDNFFIAQQNIIPKKQSTFRLSIADGLGKVINRQENIQDKRYLPKYYKQVIKEDPITHLFETINAYTLSHIRKEKQFFEEYPNDEATDSIMAKLNEYEALTQEDNLSCVLRMAGGSGFHSITGDWRFDDHTSTITVPDRQNMVYNFKNKQREPARYKSRKVVASFMELMGFVKLRVVKN
ncbi:MAG: type III-A CRISPR-associated RAMP protein Csm5 [Bacteroidota bacterium]